MNVVKLLAGAVTGRPHPAPDSQTAAGIVDAARRQAELFGIRRMTMEDVARRSGISRVTIYRHFANKDELVEAVVMREVLTLLSGLAEVAESQVSDEDRITECFVFIVGALRENALLRQLLHGEPEMILPQLTTEAAPLISFARELMVGYARRHNFLGLEVDDLEFVAEVGIRLAMSLILTPESVVDLDDQEGLRRLVKRYILPFTDREVLRLVKARSAPTGPGRSPGR
jgi:AcrR family transcriptional regulator